MHVDQWHNGRLGTGVMKHTVEVSELAGHNESPIAGDFIVSSNRDFVTRGVTTASTIVNGITSASGTVTAVAAEKITAAGMVFNPGDVFYVSLATPWTLQNDDVVLTEVECDICGFSYPRKQLKNGRCSVCVDN